uniref:Peroxisomal ATPase PEX1 n=1 Tax=Oryza punctata TaxID=4537 RepID=A0A0E0LXW1_ORYPU
MSGDGGMEVEVRVVGGARSCFAALPLHLIHALSRTSASGDLPPVLALDLRAAATAARWSLAWSGAASRSRAIEVAQELAECISLPDGTIAQLSVARSLAKADSVCIEPFSEDDWEILESRADLAEETILTQVGVVYEGMKFPLWLDGHNIVKFVVTSSSPKKSLVQLVPGTEVAVAPKKRRENSSQDVQKQNALKEEAKSKALLRVQAADRKYVHKFKYKGVELGVILSYAVLIHPETAAGASFSNLQLVTVSSKSSPKRLAQKGKEVTQKKGILLPKERVREVVVYILFSDSVSKGHVMLPHSIRHYISADIHSWVYVKKFSANVKNDQPVVTISPLHFKMHEKVAHDGSEFGSQEENIWRKTSIPSENRGPFQEARFGNNDDVLSADIDNTSESLLEHKILIKQWLVGQLKEMGLHVGNSEISPVVLPTKVLLHFEAVDQKHNRGKEFLYLLKVGFENSSYSNSQGNAELSWSIQSDDLENLELKFGRLELGEPESFDSVLDDGFSNGFKLTRSSLGWMENAMSDVTKNNVVSVSSYPQLPQSSSSSDSIVRYLADIMDEYKDKIRNACGYGPIALMASAQSLQSLPQDLTSSGRFDFHVELPVLSIPEREALLKHHVEERELQCSKEVLSEIASKCDGYDAYDLDILVDRAVHAAASRFVLPSSASLDCAEPTLGKEDFLKAMHDFLPVAMRDLSKYAPADSEGGWEDVGGLNEAVTIIKEPLVVVGRRNECLLLTEQNNRYDTIHFLLYYKRDTVIWFQVKTLELPSKYPNIFTKAPVRLRSNILLYGPSGCGKTHIVRAAAAACSLRFISVKGPELLNKYIGSSEQSVRDFFAKAAAAAPCLLFFDEFESIAPQRGTHSAGVSDRVVNQFLTELDGVESLTGVFVFAATSKPQLIDAALLRPGRFDRLILCDFPGWQERLEILKVHSRTASLASDASLEDVASLTEGFTGADLAAILTDAALAAVHEFLEDRNNGVSDTDREPCISKELLMSVARKARPSTSEDQKRQYDMEFGEFVSSRKSVSTKARESKGAAMLCSLAQNKNGERLFLLG